MRYSSGISCTNEQVNKKRWNTIEGDKNRDKSKRAHRTLLSVTLVWRLVADDGALDSWTCIVRMRNRNIGSVDNIFITV
ncbi:hypothetical protein Y032_0040g207 [Ancylostoma ceylanicum]|uniref:Uncharacterized protein n=1 Tax=Ancylostoma ceylanicum TaxID=53326 RepID=A0A016UHZ0_9BILA|nr:hypothetical protein Y032_0040g207 [Ancylostoma ceylanicum]